MNYPIWEIPAPGLLIAVVAIVHVFIAHVAVGGGLFLVVAETLLRRERDEPGLACLATLGDFFVKLSLVLGTLTGVGIWFTISVVHPAATSWLLDVFLWAWVIEWVFFAVEVTAALVYYHGWNRLTPSTHLKVGWLYFGSAWLSLAAINGILGFMLAPGNWLTTRSFWDGLFNPVYFSTLVARTATSLVLAGLYVLFAASWMPAGAGCDRLRKLAAAAYVLPGALILPLTFVWFLASADGAGVSLGEAFGAKGPGWQGALGVLFQTGAAEGIPMTKTMARVSLGSLAALAAIVAVGLAAHRARFGRPVAVLLMLLGFAGIGGGEFVRENLRRPFVLANLMLVNGVELPVRGQGDPSPFSLDSLQRSGALSAARWVRWPEAVTAARAGREPVRLAPPDDAAERGKALFRLECAWCHTLDGHLGIRKLIEGWDADSLEEVISGLATPVGADGRPSAWSEPGVRLETWLGRRMPPFAGTESERRDLAVYLAGVADSGRRDR